MNKLLDNNVSFLVAGHSGLVLNRLYNSCTSTTAESRAKIWYQ